MDSRKKCQLTSEEQEQERLRLIRKEWCIQQELEKKHKERKLRMIEKYERERAEMKREQKSLRRSKSNSPQRRETYSIPDYEYSKKQASVVVNGPEGVIIDEKELHKIKISIHKESSFSTAENQSMSRKIERSIIDPNDVILPRRQNEGACPIFKRYEIKLDEIRKITFSQDEQLEKQLSINSKNASTDRRNLDNIIRHCEMFMIGEMIGEIEIM